MALPLIVQEIHRAALTWYGLASLPGVAVEIGA